MDGPTHDWDQVFASRGGFDLAYDKLNVYAKSLLARYQSDAGGGLTLRQLEAEEIVDSAFERICSEGWPPEEDVYLLLRRHIHNGIRTLAKSAGESKLVRISERPEAEATYQETEDLFAESPREKAELSDRAAFCKMVLMRLLSEESKDRILSELAEGLIEDYTDPKDLCDLVGITRPEYDAGIGRLRRRFRKIIHRDNLEEPE